MVTDNLHVDQFGTTITAPKAATPADIRVKTKVKNEYATGRSVTLETILQADDGMVLTRDTANHEISANSLYEFTQDFTGVPVSLWSPETDNAILKEMVDFVHSYDLTRKVSFSWSPLVNHWPLPDLAGKTVRVYTYTNYPTVELTLNGVSKGKKNLADFEDKMMYWDIPYEADTIRADCGSAAQPVASSELTTAGSAAKIALAAHGSHCCKRKRRMPYCSANPGCGRQSRAFGEKQYNLRRFRYRNASGR